MVPADVLRHVLFPHLRDRDVAMLACALPNGVALECAASRNASIVHRFAQRIGPLLREYEDVRNTPRWRSYLPHHILEHLDTEECEKNRYLLCGPDVDGLKGMRMELKLEPQWKRAPKPSIICYFDDEGPVTFSFSSRTLTILTRPVLVLKPHVEDVIKAFTSGYCSGHDVESRRSRDPEQC